MTRARNKKKAYQAGKSPRKRPLEEPDCNVKPKRKKRKYRSGTVALREIRKYQKNTNFLIMKAPFMRNIREISLEIKDGIRWRKEAAEALQSAAEQFLVETFEDCNLLALHGKRVTIQEKDLFLIQDLKRDKYCNF